MKRKSSRSAAEPSRRARDRAKPTGSRPGTPALAPSLTDRQRRHLRGLAHALKPLIRVGVAGLTPGVAGEADRALHDHELIKVKAAGGADREARDAMFSDLARRTASALVQRIGNVAVLYRPRADLPRILIPDADPPA
ncbi:MAG TPA: YhbY family RNA-binding protein [Steroidobacteraceae bacterium]